MAFSKYLAWFSAPHRPDNGMGCPSSLPLSSVGTEFFRRDIDKYSINRGTDEQIMAGWEEELVKAFSSSKSQCGVPVHFSVKFLQEKKQTCILRRASCRYNHKVPVCACVHVALLHLLARPCSEGSGLNGWTHRSVVTQCFLCGSHRVRRESTELPALFC